MFSDLPKEFLYSAYKVVASFADEIGTTKAVQGTAFVVAVGVEGFALVTNRHVIDLAYKDSTSKYKSFKLVRVLVTGRRDDDSIYRFALDPDAVISVPKDPLDDVAVIINPRCEPVENMASLKIFYHYALEDLADDGYVRALKPFDVVAFAGFPNEHDKLSERPLVRGGRIASDPRFEFSLNSKPAGHCIAYEVFSHGGASGSPVYAPAKRFMGKDGSRIGKLVGINAGHLQADLGQHSGLSYFYRSTVILDVLKANGVTVPQMA
ncbi:hypothetical protein [Luteimonas saliphila]|uniref:hypothetical protein n=1 Tax=Luteimonas saliphila TaxID=2804919 RepID=UPI00192D6D16|nr:hypothetical protein [Luteimonas saliphila]